MKLAAFLQKAYSVLNRLDLVLPEEPGKTDWEEYAQQMLEVLSGFDNLQNTAADYAPTPDYRPETKFEARGKRLGHGVWDLVFKRIK